MIKSKLEVTNLGKDYTETEAINALKTELEKGIESMKTEPLYTIEDVWKEIDAI